MPSPCASGTSPAAVLPTQPGTVHTPALLPAGVAYTPAQSRRVASLAVPACQAPAPLGGPSRLASDAGTRRCSSGLDHGGEFPDLRVAEAGALGGVLGGVDRCLLGAEAGELGHLGGVDAGEGVGVRHAVI